MLHTSVVACRGAAVLVVTLLLLTSGASRAGSAGQLDPAFGTGGKVTTRFGQGQSTVFGIAIDRTGRIVAVGANGQASSSDFALARYRMDGALDRSFGVRGEVRTAFPSENATATAVSIQRNGDIVVAGPTSATKSSQTKVVLARYRPDGRLDPTFGYKGEVTAPFVAGPIGVFLRANLALQSNGKIVLAGTSGAYPGGSRFAIARYAADGSLDSTFGNQGQVTTAFGADSVVATALALQQDGKFVVAGYSFTSGPTPTLQGFALARYDTDGSLDQTFGSGGEVTTRIGSSAAAAALAVQSNGKIIAAGSAFSDKALQIRHFALVRYERNGILDPSFGQNGKITTAFTNDDGIQGVVTFPDGKIVAAGTTLTRRGARFRFALARYMSDGSLDPSFGKAGKATTAFGLGDDQAHAIGVQRDGKIVVAGESYDQSTQGVKFALARYLDQTICRVPRVKHMAIAKARRALVQADCAVGRIGRAFSPTVRKGHVISQRPRAGAQRPKGAKVKLVLSKGPR